MEKYFKPVILLIVLVSFNAFGQTGSKIDNQPTKKVALVIGNGNYLSSTLSNPENDARSMQVALQNIGFTVMKYENLDQIQMKKAIDDFGAKLKGNEVGLFFYAGHGIQSKGYNYLIPVDANLQSEQQVEYDCVQADRVLALMEASGTKINIIILDACRNNPFERSWTRSATGRGLAFMSAPKGTLIAYATAPGSTASDGSGKNGLYTSALLENIIIPDITILQMFQQVRSLVSQKSNEKQTPWEATSLTGDFYFNSTITKSTLNQNSRNDKNYPGIDVNSRSYKSAGIIDSNEDIYREELYRKQQKAEALLKSRGDIYEKDVKTYQDKTSSGNLSRDAITQMEQSLIQQQQSLTKLRDSLQTILIAAEQEMFQLISGTPKGFFMYKKWRDFNNDGIGNRDEYIGLYESVYALSGLNSLGFSFYGGNDNTYSGVNISLKIICLDDGKVINYFDEKYNGGEIQNFNCESKYFLKSGNYKAVLVAGSPQEFTLEFKIVK